MGFFSEHGKYVEQRERDMSGVLSMAALEQHDSTSPRRVSSVHCLPAPDIRTLKETEHYKFM